MLVLTLALALALALTFTLSLALSLSLAVAVAVAVALTLGRARNRIPILTCIRTQAWLAEHAFEWVDVPDALPFAVGCEGADGQRTQVLPPMAAPGRSERLYFAPAASKQAVRLV